jgi:hypothetical protein
MRKGRAAIRGALFSLLRIVAGRRRAKMPTVWTRLGSIERAASLDAIVSPAHCHRN